MGDNNGYQSGGKGFTNPNQAIEAATYREFMNKAGGTQGVAGMDQAEIANIIQNMLERIANETKMTNEEIVRMVSALRETVMNAPNQQQGAKEGMNLLNKLINTDLNLMQGLEKMGGLNSAERGAVGSTNGSHVKQLLQINQGILKTLLNIDNRMNEFGMLLGDLRGDVWEIDTGNDKQNNKHADEQKDEFEALRHTIAHGLINSPTATKLGQLTSSLMSLGLMKVMGNEKAPMWLRKTAAAAVYLQIPQTVTNVLGMVVSQALTKWLVGGAGKILGGALGGLMRLAGGALTSLVGGLGSMLTALLPIAIPLVGALLIGAGIFAAIKGIQKHKEKMKENDAKIDNDPTLTQKQKDLKKLGAHTGSGAKVGAVSGALAGAGSGALAGAAIGSVIPGVGTAIGAAVGAVGGAIAGTGLGASIGALVGSIKPMGQMLGHGFKTLGQNLNKGLHTVGGHIVAGTKWANEHQDKLKALLGPATSAITTMLTLASPFFMLFKTFADHIMKSELLKKILGLSDKTSDSNMSFGDSVKSAVATAGNYVTAPFRNDIVNMSDLGLKGKIDSGNSVAKTKKENVQNVQQLDYLLNSWGYNVVYTSNMGGKHQTGSDKTHASGNKVDLQLFDKAGNTVQMTPAQLNRLKELGYWGNGNGALGWEPVKGQKGGGHYDLHIGKYVQADNSFQQLMESRKKAEAEAQKKKAEEAEKAKKKAEQQEAINKAKGAVKSAGNAVVTGAANAVAGVVSGIDKFTKMQNSSTTNKMVEEGAN